MFNYLIEIEYDGTNFSGWQIQKNSRSVQGTIETALKKVLKKNIRISGAGRTDKGVHALSQHANFKIKKKIESKKIFLESLNFFLKKKSISILNLKDKTESFHARHSVKLRFYEYMIINRLGTLSLNRNKAWHVKKELNLNLIRKGAKKLEGTHDFSSFRAASCSAKSPIKKMHPIKIIKSKDTIKIRFSSKSFLQNQVRSMVGCLKYLSEGRWTLKEFESVLKKKKRSLCAPPAPACGLYLSKILY